MMLRLYNEANVELIDNSLFRRQKTEATLDQASENTLKNEEESAPLETAAVENGVPKVPLEN
jgi:hypothetical protein